MSTIKYTEDHEWIRVEGDIATVGITDYAQEQLGDVVFVELPDAGKAVEKGGEAAVVESVVNSDPAGAGWFFKMRIADAGELDGLMDEAAYKSHVEGLD